MWQRKRVVKRLRTTLLILYAYIAILMISNADELEQQASSLLMLFLVAITTTLVYFLSKWKTAIIDLTIL